MCYFSLQKSYGHTGKSKFLACNIVLVTKMKCNIEELIGAYYEVCIELELECFGLSFKKFRHSA